MKTWSKRAAGCILGITLGGVCACAIGMGEPPQIEDSKALAGPTLGSDATKTSLVQRDFDGKVRCLEISPEEAAVRLLKLDGETQRKVDAVIASRALALDTFVRTNLELLLKFSTAKAAGDAQDQGMLLREAYEKAEPIRQEGRLLDTIGAALPKEHAATFKRLAQDYYKALIDEVIANDEKSGKKKPGRAGAMMKIGLEQFGQDVKRSYERVIAEGQGKLNELVKHLELSPEQEQTVRKLTTDFALAHIKEPASGREKAGLFLAVSASLTPQQRGKLLAYIQENK